MQSVCGYVYSILTKTTEKTKKISILTSYPNTKIVLIMKIFFLKFKLTNKNPPSSSSNVIRQTFDDDDFITDIFINK